MPQYIFTYNEQDNSFPERYRVVEDDGELLNGDENLSGTVLKTEAIEFLDKLLVRYQSKPYIITEMVDAPNWEFIALRFNPAEAEKTQAGKRII